MAFSFALHGCHFSQGLGKDNPESIYKGMSRYGNYTFAFLMLIMAFLTVARYRYISEFKAKSQDFSIVVVGEKADVSAIRADLRNMTFQSVDQEDIGDGRYRLRIKCPPESADSIFSVFSGFKILRENP